MSAENTPFTDHTAHLTTYTYTYSSALTSHIIYVDEKISPLNDVVVVGDVLDDHDDDCPNYYYMYNLIASCGVSY